MKIEKNENKTDRIIRGVLAVVFFLVAMFWSTGAVQVILYVLAVVMLITAVAGFCGLYKLFGIDTNIKK